MLTSILYEMCKVQLVKHSSSDSEEENKINEREIRLALHKADEAQYVFSNYGVSELLRFYRTPGTYRPDNNKLVRALSPDGFIIAGSGQQLSAKAGQLLRRD